jgi:hypothetical protein
VKKISLTNSKKIVKIDDDDFERVSNHNWYINGSGYAGTTIKGDTFMLHRFVMNAKRGQEIDHKNSNKLDCTKENLRFCTRTQNLARRGIQKHNTSGFVGVSWDKLNNKFRSYVCFNGRSKTLGRFETAKEAAIARDKFAKKCFGEFAYQNNLEVIND